ncbi:DUF4317 family protein [Alkalicoccus chagannorensis]|uniref:DUF4317 family protein n=1 Tax=Alkalicoccus chagannorensis TaxID=427072 RepID=UPI000478D6E6|nr:DUF4317 family protein [Alkalicoccus chagannorensis]
MDKKDLAAFRRQLKPEQTKLQLKEVFNLYVLKETTEVYHAETQPFEMLEREQQELFFQSFKKTLTGRMDEKLFPLKFQQGAETQRLLHQVTLESEGWQDHMMSLAEKMIAEHPHEKDRVITFVRGEYQQSKKKSGDAETDSQQPVYATPFILCAINKTQDPDREMLFDYVEKEFKYKINVDPVIDVKHPLGGFLFPVVTDGVPDVNYLLYAAEKPNMIDPHFTEEVLQSEEPVTAAEEKEVFEDVVKHIVGDQLPPAALAGVYGEINKMVEESVEEEAEPPKLGYQDVERVLNEVGQGVEAEEVKAAFQYVTTEENYEVKASSIVPRYASKSIKIKTKAADVTISQQDLQYVKQVNFGGRRCIMIEIDEDAELDGFRMLPEEFGYKVEEEEPEDE